ncbi:enoyl-CoA hydratase [Actinomycetospora sp. Odt1-22]|uniref:Enoyl-CoA hydratase n=1 Tax=Actinomycetospora termitidis TaxID=3053470 RepID=A0ABT7M1J0_9PSEU|nr:enoyl-CoA hydratase [Actinomycetospora sp. Odt1-22]MDL5154522.1 enoyl-CoA hydratase [Actinomycetospora sp. Odt1-22]
MIESLAHDAVTELRIARPDRRNALDTEHCRDLHAALDEAVAGGARAIVLTGEGTAFCSGADLHTVGDAGFLDALYAMLQRLVAVEVPVVAAVQGPAIGAGTQLAIAADLRVCSEQAVFGLPTAALGLAVDPWTVRRLALLAGGGPARRMLLACERLDVTAAAGLVDRVAEDAPASALAWAAEMAELAPLTLAYNKLAVNRLLEDPTDPETLDAVAAGFSACWSSEDLAEGRRAREERRAPRFVGK